MSWPSRSPAYVPPEGTEVWFIDQQRYLPDPTRRDIRYGFFGYPIEADDGATKGRWFTDERAEQLLDREWMLQDLQK